MFYSQCLVSRKGPLGSIWVAAYFFKNLRKTQVKDTHIPSSVDRILQKELDALTYRVLAYLLLGVVRIYSKKVDFLFDDCNKALIGVKEFVTKEKNKENTTVSLPASAKSFSIALPKSFELNAFVLEDLEDFHGGNVKPQEDITLQDRDQETENMDQYSAERFDMEEDLQFTFQETFCADHNETRHESLAHDMDVDTENFRDTTVEAPVKVVEAEPLDSNESPREHQNASKHKDNQESDGMLVESQMSEDIRRDQEEDTVFKTLGTIVQRLMDPHESSEDCLHRAGHRENSDSEKTSVEGSWEKMRHESPLPSEWESPEATHGIEEQPSGATRIYGEEIPEMSPLEEPEPESVTDSRDLPVDIEKLRGHSDGEMTDFVMSHGSHKEPTETSDENQIGLRNGTEKGFLSDMTFSEEGSKRFNAKDTSKAPSWRISEGETSHQFSIIPTPATKESARVSRKRKCLIDNEVIIPNKVMKKMIEDSSPLITKRRKFHDTNNSESRTKRFTDPSRNFLNTLIPYASDLQLLFCQSIKVKEQNNTETPKSAKTTQRMKNSPLETIGNHEGSSEQTGNAQENMDIPQAASLTELRVTVSPENVVSSIAVHQTEVAPDTPLKHAEPVRIAPGTPARTSEQTEIAPETPVRETMLIRYFKDPETCDKETRPTSSFTSFEEHPLEFNEERRDLDAILMNEEVNAQETQDLKQEKWSARTRNVAKFLEKTFTEKEEEKVSLLELCKGRTQKENARLFYETLVLKTKGYLEVKQEKPYGDIILTR